MSTAELREAAALMRSLADFASAVAPSPWLVDGCEITTDDQEPIEPLCVITSELHWQEASAIREHVASWHPAVALAVADWLEAMADYIELVMAGHPGWKASVHHATTIARAYLGRSA